MRIIELFAGIGACSAALKRIGIDLEIVDAVEIDKYAMASFNAIHGTNFEPQDITTWNKDLKDIDLITHGSPCQDFSVAGKQAGGDLGSGTRSSLMYETIRIVGQVQPKYVLWENVKNILSKKHKHNFDAYIETMNVLGYNSYYQVLNAKDYGIPQNRERVYTVSIRKDIDNGAFVFPEKEELKLRLKDMLEDEVEEKYYLKDYQIENIKKSNFNVTKRRMQEKDYYDTLCARDWKDPKCVQVGNLKGGKWDKINESCRRVYSQEGISPTIHTCQGGNTEPKIMAIGNYMPSGHDASRIVDSNRLAPTVKENHGTVTATLINQNAKHQQDLVQDAESICRTIPAGTHGSTPHLLKTIVNKEPFIIRKLTPKECWRLMGFSDEDFEKSQNIPTSNTQLYKQAGNSIVVNVLEKIFKNLFNNLGG